MNIFSARLSIQGLWNWLPSFLGANTTSEVPNWIFGVEYPEGSSRVDSRLKGIIGAVLTALLMHGDQLLLLSTLAPNNVGARLIASERAMAILPEA